MWFRFDLEYWIDFNWLPDSNTPTTPENRRNVLEKTKEREIRGIQDLELFNKGNKGPEDPPTRDPGDGTTEVREQVFGQKGGHTVMKEVGFVTENRDFYCRTVFYKVHLLTGETTLP